MGQNAGQSLGAKGREDLHKFYPWQLTLIVGKKIDKRVKELADAGFLSLRVDEKHMLYQKERAEEGIDLDLVESMKPKSDGGEGQLQNVRVWRDGPDKIVLFGRGRVKALAELAFRLAEKTGKTREQLEQSSTLEREIPRVSSTVLSGDLVTAWRQMTAENMARHDLSLRQSLLDAQRGKDLGVPDEDTARLLKVDVATMKLKLKFFDLAEPVQEAICAKEMPESLGYLEFSKWTRDDQVKHLAEMRENGSLRGQAAQQAVADIRAGKKIADRKKNEEPAPKRAPSKVAITRWVDNLKEESESSPYIKGMRAGLMMALGKDPRGVPAEVKAILKGEG